MFLYYVVGKLEFQLTSFETHTQFLWSLETNLVYVVFTDPNDCYQEDGQNYRGTVSETEGGLDCLNWNSFFILEKGGDPFTDYQDFDGIGPHNYCRWDLWASLCMCVQVGDVTRMDSRVCLGAVAARKLEWLYHLLVRNPDGDSRPWCFVNKKGKLRWDHCDVRSCSGSGTPPTPHTHTHRHTPKPYMLLK